jgi:hypothetical protein
MSTINVLQDSRSQVLVLNLNMLSQALHAVRFS